MQMQTVNGGFGHVSTLEERDVFNSVMEDWKQSNKEALMLNIAESHILEV